MSNPVLYYMLLTASVMGLVILSLIAGNLVALLIKNSIYRKWAVVDIIPRDSVSAQTRDRALELLDTATRLTANLDNLEVPVEGAVVHFHKRRSDH
jgi:hypothetical protein